jgi:hypothetical protein
MEWIPIRALPVGGLLLETRILFMRTPRFRRLELQELLQRGIYMIPDDVSISDGDLLALPHSAKSSPCEARARGSRQLSPHFFLLLPAQFCNNNHNVVGYHGLTRMGFDLRSYG